jgi:hypothetical protein
MRPVLRFCSRVFVTSLFLMGCAHDAPTVASVDNAPKAPPLLPVVPVSAMFPASAQLRLLAGQHWQIIAQNAAHALSIELRRGQRCGFGADPCRALYVAGSSYETSFSRAFVNSLVTALVQQGIYVSQTAEDALILHVDMQGVRFSRGTGALKALAPGLWTPVAGNEAADASPSERSEIIVTLSVLDGPRYVARNTNVYYVSQADQLLYEQEICSLIRPCREDGVRPGQPSSSIRNAPIPLVGDPQ